tara:strand:+ start:200 stop:1018 length:819 start_codon:yes stop_codon:yes gene_type:complete
MFKNVILCRHNLGQRLKEVSNSPDILSKYINKDIHKIDSQCKTKFNKSIENIFTTNKEVIGPRINIGGDHSITIGTGAASLKRNKNTKFLWFDAHADLNTFESSLTKNYHGMVLGYLSGAAKHPHFEFIQTHLKLNNLMYIGLRSIDDYENKIIKENDIPTIRARECNNNVDNVINKIKEFVKDEEVHLSFDVDVLDPKVLSSTGTAVAYGTNKSTTKMIINQLLKDTNVTNLDICELNMNIGDKRMQERSLNVVLDIFDKSVFDRSLFSKK